MNLTARDINPDGIFYHVAPIPLEIDSIIKKGNWGRVKQLTFISANVNHMDWIVPLREKIFEYYRVINFPDKVSRLNCVFTSKTLAIANEYKQRNQPTGIIYEVTPVDCSCKTHIGEWDKSFEIIPNCIFPYNYFEGKAKDYWENNWLNSTTSEILLASDIKIIKMI